MQCVDRRKTKPRVGHYSVEHTAGQDGYSTTEVLRMPEGPDPVPESLRDKTSSIHKDFTLLQWVGGRYCFNGIIGAPGRIQFFQGLCISVSKGSNQFSRLTRLVAVAGPYIGIAHQ